MTCKVARMVRTFHLPPPLRSAHARGQRGQTFVDTHNNLYRGGKTIEISGRN